MKEKIGLGMLAIVLVFGLAIVSCDNNDSTGDRRPPEERPVAERWSTWIYPSSTATLRYSVDSHGVNTITIGGAPSERWHASAQYAYTARGPARHYYAFEAWTESEGRWISVQYYGGRTGGPFLAQNFWINDNRTPIVMQGSELPAGGVNDLEFRGADQLGTFFVRVLGIGSEAGPNVILTGTRWVQDGRGDRIIEFTSASEVNFVGRPATYTVSGNVVTVTVDSDVFIHIQDGNRLIFVDTPDSSGNFGLVFTRQN